MTYKLTKTDGTQIALINDFTTDTTSSLQIPGRGVSNYSGIIGNDMIALMEHFASPVAPSNPIEGQVWYRTIKSGTTNFDGNLYVYNNGSWNSASKVIMSSTIPDIVGDGTLWLMQPENMIWMYDSSISAPVPEFIRDNMVSLVGSWRLIGPQFSSESNTRVYEKKVIDTNKQYHSVIVTEVNGSTNTIHSKDEFLLDTTITGNLTDFVSLDLNGNPVSVSPPIYAGLNLNNITNGIQDYFNGMSIISKNLLNFDMTDVIGRGSNLDLRKTYPVNDITTDLGSASNRWNNFYCNNIYCNNIVVSNQITIQGSLAATQDWVNDTLSSNITLAQTTSFDTTGLVTTHRISSTPTDTILSLCSDVGGLKTNVANVLCDGTIDVIGPGNLKDHGSRVIVTNPLLSTEIDVLNIVSDPTNNRIRITDSSNTFWDLSTIEYVNDNFLSRKTNSINLYDKGNSLVYDTNSEAPYFEYGTTGSHLATLDYTNSTFLKISGGSMNGNLNVLTPPIADSTTLAANTSWVKQQGYSTVNYVNSVTTSSYITSHININSDSNNLLRNTSDGLMVELSGTQTYYYVSSTLGNDSNNGNSESTPMKTIRAVLNKTPDNTSITIYLKSGDTFRLTDGVTSYVENGEYQQIVSATYDIGSRSINFDCYGNDIYENYIENFQYKEAITADYYLEIGTQPILKFVYSSPTDVLKTNKVTSGFNITSNSGSITFYQTTIKITDNSPSTSTIVGAYQNAFFPQSGNITFVACNFILSSCPVIAGAVENSGSCIIQLSTSRFDISNGTKFMTANMGCTLKAPFVDNTSSQIGDTVYYTRTDNFNSTIANENSFIDLEVIDSNARIYRGLATQNKLDN